MQLVHQELAAFDGMLCDMHAAAVLALLQALLPTVTRSEACKLHVGSMIEVGPPASWQMHCDPHKLGINQSLAMSRTIAPLSVSQPAVDIRI